MTDRFHSLIVVLECDIRVDDVEPILTAIRMVRGVLSVSGEVANSESHMAEVRARMNLAEKLREVIHPSA